MLKEVKFCGKEGIRPYVKGGQISFEKEANILMIKRSHTVLSWSRRMLKNETHKYKKQE